MLMMDSVTRVAMAQREIDLPQENHQHKKVIRLLFCDIA